MPGDTQTSIAVKTSLLVYIAFTLAIGIVGLAESYFFFTSPAWTADYGIALTGKETFTGENKEKASLSSASFGHALAEAQADSVLSGTRSGVIGLLIELLRLFIIAAVFYFLVGVALDSALIGSLGVPPPFSAAWFKSPETKILLLLAAIVLGGLAYYHFHYAPVQLEHSPKYWFALKNSKRLWELVPSPTYGVDFWYTWFQGTEAAQLRNASAIRDLNFPVAQRVMFFYLPYAGYFLYSLAIYLLLATPALIVSFRAIRHFTTSTYSSINAFRYEMPLTTPREEIAERAKNVIKVLLEDLWFFGRCFLLVLGVTTFENVLGKRTLAPSALFMSGVVVCLFLATVLIPAYAFWKYDTVGSYIRLNSKAEGADVPTALEVLLEKENIWKIVKTGVSAVTLFLVNVILGK